MKYAIICARGMFMKKVIQKKQEKLQEIKIKIEQASTKKEVEQIQQELDRLKKEVKAFANPALKKDFLKRLEIVRTKEEVFQLSKEINDLKKETDKREEEVQEKEKKIEEKEQTTEEMQEIVDEYEKTVDSFIKRIEEALKSSETLRERALKDIEVTETVEVVKKRQGVLLDTLLLLYIARSNMDKKLKVPLTLLLVSNIADKLQEKDEIITHYEYFYEDIEKIIDDALDSIVDIEKEMNDSLADVRSTTKQFEKEFGEFKGMREFDDIIEMFEVIEETIAAELGVVKDIENDLEKSKDENREKVLKLDSNK